MDACVNIRMHLLPLQDKPASTATASKDLEVLHASCTMSSIMLMLQKPQGSPKYMFLELSLPVIKRLHCVCRAMYCISPP